MTISPRGTLDRELARLRDELLRLGSLVDSAIERALRALQTRDLALARQVSQDDQAINDLRYKIEEDCLALIATQQPAAVDLRTTVAILNIIIDLERMADHAAGIAEIVIRMGTEPLLKPLIDIPRMAQIDREMLRRSLDAFIAHDPDLAREVAQRDDEVDHLYNQIFRELLTYMIEDPKTITRATYLLWVAHNLERIGDRVTNISERVVFMTTGIVRELNV
ncbi:MAG: phosphate transport system regulatory protein PhoU [Chloroflexota bacterium]